MEKQKQTLSGGSRRCVLLRLLSCRLLTGAVTVLTVPKKVSDLQYIARANLPMFLVIAALETIPKEASVQASPFFTAKLSSRAQIYELPSKNETDYIVIDLRPGFYFETFQQAHMEYLQNGYESVYYQKDLVEILRKLTQ